jgi:hypothetical protein
MKTLLELEENDCRFPIGDEDIKFCAKPRHVFTRLDRLCTSSYCHEHHLICTVEPYVRRAAA